MSTQRRQDDMEIEKKNVFTSGEQQLS